MSDLAREQIDSTGLREMGDPRRQQIDRAYRPIGGALIAEQAVLGLILELSKETGTIVETLGNGRCFTDTRHRIIYQAAVGLIRQGKQPDLVTVVDHLRASGLLEQAGGASYLSGLPNTGVDSSSGQYSQEIIDASRRIEFDRALSVAREDIRNGGDLSAVAEKITASIEEVSVVQRLSPRYAVQSLSDILDRECEETSWRVDGLLPCNGLGILSGESGCGKTWLVLGLALAVAQGGLWLGHFKTTNGTVLLIDEESGEPLLKKRLELLGARSISSPCPLWIACFQGPQLDTPGGQEELASEIRRLGVKLVIIDSLVRVHTRDENSASDMKILTSGLARITRVEDCAILLTHHARKKTKESNDAGQMLRGTSELKAAVDLHLYARGSGGEIRIEHDKARYARALAPLLVRIEDRGDGSVRLAAMDEKDAKVEQAKGLIIDTLAEAGEPVFRKDLESRCRGENISSRTFANALKRLKDEGKLNESDKVEHTANGRAKTPKAFSLR
ncbi:MAG: AAA family ATPase [Candidatus Eisenbacteria bacterium]